MHPLLLRRLRPVAAVVLVFFSWFSIEPWNFALAAQSPPTPRVGHSSASRQDAPTAPEVFEANLRSIKEQVGAARDGEAYQAQLTALLKELGTAREQSGRDLEQTRQAVDRLARAIQHGTPRADALKAIQVQRQTVKTAIGHVRMNVAGIEGLLRGMALPAGLTQSHKQAKEAVASLIIEFEKRLAALAQRAEQQRGFDLQEHQAFLAASVALEQGLAALQDRIGAVAQEATPERRRAQLWQEAFSRRDSLLAADREIRKEFDQTEAFLKEKGLPQEILDRHYAAVSDYEKNFNQLKAYFSQVDKANRAYMSASERGNETAAQAAERDLESNLTAFDDYLKANVKDPPHQPLDPNNLPHRTPKSQERKPRLKKEEFAEFQTPIRLAYNGDPANLMLAQATPDLPTPEDLAETIEVQFTPEIQALAAELEHNPVKIYSWVRNNIDFVPTYGSIQGAHMCLLTKQCNDMDTASLLIALLRTSGIAARYVIGTIDVPIEQVMNWVGGFTDERAVLNFIASGGTPVTGLVSGGRVVTARMEHVWTEAYVDYIPSRGSVHKQGDSWISLDASFKQYIVKAAINVQQITGFDGAAFVDQTRSSATVNEMTGSVTGIAPSLVQSDMLSGRTLVSDFVRSNPAIGSVNDIMGGREIKQQKVLGLPGTMPYRTTVAGAKASILPDSLRHKISLSVTDPTGTTDHFSFVRSLPELASRKLTLSYAPASDYDESALVSYVGLAENYLPAYLIHLVPELRLDGEVIAAGGQVGMGTQQQLSIVLSSPQSGENRITNATLAGTYSAIVLNLGFMPELLDKGGNKAQEIKVLLDTGSVDGLTKDDIMGEFLFSAGVAYWSQSDLFNRLAARVFDTAIARVPSEGIFSYDVKVNLLFGTPFTATIGGLSTDIDQDVQVVLAKDGDRTKERGYMGSSGMIASRLEASNYDLLLNTNFTGAGISTAHLLEFSNQQAIPVYQINQTNINAILPLLSVAAQVKADIANSVSVGRVVLVPEREITKDGWVGVGYLAIDPDTGAGAYLISGGLAGGSFTCQCFNLPPLQELIVGLILIAMGTFAAGGTALAFSVVSVLIGVISLISAQCQIEKSTSLTDEEKEMINGMFFGFFVTAVLIEGLGLWIGSLAGGPAIALLAGSILFLVMSIIFTNLITSYADILAARRNAQGNP